MADDDPLTETTELDTPTALGSVRLVRSYTNDDGEQVPRSEATRWVGWGYDAAGELVETAQGRIG
jgi:hypothetical protein